MNLARAKRRWKAWDRYGNRIGAFIRRHVQHAIDRLPNWPDPKATCPAHGRRYCQPCHANPGDCESGDRGGCGYWSATGMHWDTCPNRIGEAR